MTAPQRGSREACKFEALPLRRGATLTKVAATGEAMAYGMMEIDAAESANRYEIAHCALADAEKRWLVANRLVGELTALRDRSAGLLPNSRIAVAEARRLLAIP
jgi:hypothetical protein